MIKYHCKVQQLYMTFIYLYSSNTYYLLVSFIKGKNNKMSTFDI